MTALTWHRAGQWFETSDCGRFNVAASKVDGKYVFQAWDGKQLLHTDTDAQACKAICERTQAPRIAREGHETHTEEVA